MRYAALIGAVLASGAAFAEEEAPAPAAPAEDAVPAEKPRYLEVGGSFGTPAVFNLVVGYQTERLGVRASGMTLGSFGGGLQVSPVIHFGPGNKAWHGIAIPLGHFELQGLQFNYAGIAYQVSTRGGFYFEAGLAGGTGDYSNPQVIFQIGGLARIPLNESAKAAKTAPR